MSLAKSSDPWLRNEVRRRMKTANPKFTGEPLFYPPNFMQLAWGDDWTERVIAGVNAQFRGTAAEIRPNFGGRNNQIYPNLFSLFAIDAVARGLKNDAGRVMYPEECELLISQGRLPGQGNVNHNLAGVLDFSGRHHSLAVRLYKQLPQDLQDLDRLPALLVGLGVRKQEREGFSLEFTFKDYSQLRTAKILNNAVGDLGFSSSDPELVRTGLPSVQVSHEHIDRILIAAEQKSPTGRNLGLNRLFVGTLQHLYGGCGLEESNYKYRVVCVSGGNALRYSGK